MSNPNLNPSLRAPVVAVVPSASLPVGTAHSVDAIDMGNFANVMAVAVMGAFGEDATATLTFQQATTEAFTDAKAIKGLEPIDLAANKAGVVNLKATSLDIKGKFRFVRPLITVGTAAVHGGVVVQGFDARDQPAPAVDGTVVG